MNTRLINALALMVRVCYRYRPTQEGGLGLAYVSSNLNPTWCMRKSAQ